MTTTQTSPSSWQLGIVTLTLCVFIIGGVSIRDWLNQPEPPPTQDYDTNTIAGGPVW